MPTDQSFVSRLIPFRLTELHSIFLVEAVGLSVTKHRQARQSTKHCCNTEIIIAVAKLLDSSFLIWVVHEVDVTLEDLRIELKCVLDRHAILGIIFIAQHVHKG